MGNAFLLTHSPKYLEPLRRQLENLYAAKREENGRVLLPNKYGDQGWYGYGPNEHFDVQRDLYLWSMDKRDLEHLGKDEWIQYPPGQECKSSFGRAAARRSAIVRRRVAGSGLDPSTS